MPGEGDEDRHKKKRLCRNEKHEEKREAGQE